jgi:membrane protein required for colicin V production
MNLVDILIWVVLLIFAVKGFMKGLVREVCSLLGLVLGGWIAFACYHPLAEVLRSHIRLPYSVASFLSFAVIFLASGLLFFFLGHLLTTLFKIILLGGVNRIGGVLIGVVQGALVLCVALSLGTLKPMPGTVRAHIERAASARPFLSCGNELLSWWKNGAASRKVVEPGKTPSGDGTFRTHSGKIPENNHIR